MVEPPAKEGVLDVLPAEPMMPVQPEERIEVVDILRGFAVFGILIVNMTFYERPVKHIAELDWPDRLVLWGIIVFAQGKFYTMFSFLFGLGLAIQMRRAAERGAEFVPLAVRRLLVLLGLGMVHAFLLWMGDILMTYAILGFILLVFRTTTTRTLLIASGVLLLVPILLFALIVGMVEFASQFMSPEELAEIEKSGNWEYEWQRESARIYGEGTFGEIMVRRAIDVLFMYSGLPLFGPTVLALFFLGLVAGRHRVFHDISGHLPLFRRLFWWGLGLGLVFNGGQVVIEELADANAFSWPVALQKAGFILGGPAFCFCYIAIIVFLTRRRFWQRILSPLGDVGRMALTNYLMQSVICTTIFYSYGFGYHGRIGPLEGLGLTVAIYAVQVVWSVAWFRLFRFRSGPLEWLWRRLTYGHAPPTRA